MQLKTEKAEMTETTETSPRIAGYEVLAAQLRLLVAVGKATGSSEITDTVLSAVELTLSATRPSLVERFRAEFRSA